MSAVFSPEGSRKLRGGWILLAASIACAVGLGLAGKWHQEREKRARQSAGQNLDQARLRVENARRERDNLRESADIFGTLVERGLLQGERRLDMVELVNGLRERFQLFSLEYEVAPQRPLPLPGGRIYPAVDILSSRVKLRMRALHEGDVVGFMEELAASRQGFFLVDRCVLRRLEAASPDAIVPRVEAECGFEWITLKEKNASRPG